MLASAQGSADARVVDLSMGGTCVFVRGTVRKGEFVRITLPIEGLEDTPLHAVVVRAHPTELPEHTVVGLSFLALPGAAVPPLSRAVRASLEG